MTKKFKDLTKDFSPARRERIEKRKAALRSEAYALNELRKELELTQSEIAKLLDMEQGAISRLERQEDMYVSTLQRFIEALGGKLRLVASFPEREKELLLGRTRE